MMITIITVVYNGENEIVQTMESVLNQSAPPFEYIIIDGASSDKTLHYITQYKKFFIQKGIELIVVSERDNGLYDAMNKGLRLAKGDYIGFLNCGDWYELGALEIVRNTCKRTNCDLAYGTMRYWNNNGRVMDKKSRKDVIVSSRNWNHPTCFAKRNLYLSHLFNDDFGPYADFEWYLATRKKNVQIAILPPDQVITNFRLGGVSNTTSFWASIKRAGNKYKAYKSNGYICLYILEAYVWELIKFIFMYLQKFKK